MVPFSVRLCPAIIGLGGQPNSCHVCATVGPPPRDLGSVLVRQRRNGEMAKSLILGSAIWLTR